MLQVPCYSPPVFGHSHYKKFWLRQTEVEDDPSLSNQQHVSSCSQKLTAVSSPLSAMVGGSISSGQSVGGCNVSLAACASSFSTPRPSSTQEPGATTSKGIMEYDLNQFEDSLEPCAVDCTLSLGSSKRECTDTPTGLSRSGSPSRDTSVALFSTKSPWNPVLLETPANFMRECTTDCVRDIFPQSSIPACQTTICPVPPKQQEDIAFACRQVVGSSPSNPSSGRIAASDIFLDSPKASFYDAEKIDSPHSSAYVTEGCGKELLRKPSDKPWRPLLLPDGGTSDSKYCDMSFAASGLGSPMSGQSSVNRDEMRFVSRTSFQEFNDCGANATRSVGRACAHCGTLKTPLWRNGPQGPKSLCNACGIRFKKAGRRNASNATLQDGQGPQLSSPHSVKLFPSKSLKRKSDSIGGASRQYWPSSDEASLPSPQGWKKGKVSDERDLVDSSGSEGEAGGSSGTSCVTWQPRASTTACNPPLMPITELPVLRSPSIAEYITLGDPFYSEANVKCSKSGKTGAHRKPFAKDEEEGAVLLMALSCGLVNA